MHELGLFVEADPDLAWLDENDGWLWYYSGSDSGNVILTLARKTLSVAVELDLTRLRSAVRRHYRTGGTLPPPDVMLAMFDQANGLLINGFVVSAEPPLDWREVLSQEEAALAQIFVDEGPLVEYDVLKEEWAARGGNPNTLVQYLQMAPFVERLQRELYGLIGAT
jgi:hypothetical protein